jgi:hypothetical protein
VGSAKNAGKFTGTVGVIADFTTQGAATSAVFILGSSFAWPMIKFL